MMLIRPIVADDLEALYCMARNAGIGVTTLPANEELLARRIEHSERSFARSVDPQEAYYLFALEDTSVNRVVGVSGIMARVGLDEVWYNYRVSTTVNASTELGIHKQTPTLYLTNDMTDCSEICTLFLHEDYRNGHNGQLLSKCRFLFMADFAEYFSSKVFAEMRGYTDDDGSSPFWECLGRKFFTMEFSQADYLTGLGNKAFIAELMPKYPIYLPFLSEHAREVVGQVHPHTRPALAMLESEGFNYNGLVDIFDAGPLVEAFVHNVRTIQESVRRHAMPSKSVPEAIETPWMVSNRSFENFRVALVDQGQLRHDAVSLSHDFLEALQIEPGDMTRVVSLRARKPE